MFKFLTRCARRVFPSLQPLLVEGLRLILEHLTGRRVVPA